MGRFTLLNSLQKPVRNSIPLGPVKVADSQKAGIPEAGDWAVTSEPLALCDCVSYS